MSIIYYCCLKKNCGVLHIVDVLFIHRHACVCGGGGGGGGVDFNV